MRDLLKSLAGCEDLASLKSTLAKLFTQFGEIAQMDVLTMTQPGKRQALCFLRLASAAQEQQAMANLGVTRFGNELLLVVDLPAAQAHAAEPLAHRTDNGRQSESEISSLTATT